MRSGIPLQHFRPADQTTAKNLILAGLAEHRAQRDLSKNPDLNDIASTYANGVFLVARLRAEIVGTGALLPHSNGVAQIVGMSVRVTLQSKPIGTLILRHLIQHAKNNG